MLTTEGSSLPIGFIVLAAGAARRYGSCKLAAPFSEADPTPVLSKTLLGLAKAIPSVPVLVVSCEAQPEVIAIAKSRNVATFVMPGQSPGMGSSLASAVSIVRHWSGCFICLADMPFIQVQTYQLLYRYASLSKPSILAPTYAGQRGHPVYFDHRHFPELASLSGEYGATKLLQSRDVKLISVTDSGVVQDIDHPSDH